jgi:hypothetical protein
MKSAKHAMKNAKRKTALIRVMGRLPVLHCMFFIFHSSPSRRPAGLSSAVTPLP